jgi:hypothetical protein
MKLAPEGITAQMIREYLDRSDPDPKNWKLRVGAPEIMRQKFEEVIRYYTSSDNVDLES